MPMSCTRYHGSGVAALLAAIALLLATASPTAAQLATSTCLAVARHSPVQSETGRIIPASLETTSLQSDEVRITYVGHSAFRIETPAGISIITDYSGNHSDGGLPTVVTMNHAHGTHYTDFPDPGIEHVLRGWNPDGDGPARHRLELEDVLIRNVATDLYYDMVLRERDGNSIFIFEVAGLCIGHLGHLHHKLTPEHIAEIGRLDILFMPVDGTYTMSQAGMIELAQQLRSSIVIPMHFFSSFSLQRFLTGMEGAFAPELPGTRDTVVSLRSLPQSPVVRVLNPW